jgi:hypothetical protein
VPEFLRLRDRLIPAKLIMIRLGSKTFDDRKLTDQCERSRGRWGFHGFSVFEVPDGDYRELARLEPIVAERPKLFEADGPELLAAGFPLFPTMEHPHWTVVLSEPTFIQFDRVRGRFRGPIDNPVWTKGR